ncbi:GNAT family N-acetyltransferase [Aliikangiella coralliicola]|uniref:GNAT family N-acetyltransferase n=1 Tax=Aliikangiella coralliicola TaxID=2592383 RepID=A0A545UIN3_9GAMM|nr:GNAT family N-acetyltransferase [Aliikangiella coralliicola]TQV89328.1 GNAT family N-acetyltransferase [Aliikangiella coralliicola]
MQIRKTTKDDIEGVYQLYREVAKQPGGIARLTNEVTLVYVRDFLSKSLLNGVSYVCVDDSEKIIGEIHAYSPGIFCFSHILSDLSVVIDSDAQGQGAGRLLFETFMLRVINDFPSILRVELIARESNKKAISFYQSLGFSIEGKLSGRIKTIDGDLEADIPMAWIRQ